MEKIVTKTLTQKFLDPEEVLAAIPLESEMTVVDFGCGNGYYSVAAAKIVGPKGQVFALDILEEALSQTSTLAKLNGMINLATKQCDLEEPGSCQVPDTSADVGIISSILHQLENKENLIREAYRCLKTGGRLLVVEWQPTSPIGPDASLRVSPEQVRQLLERFSFRPVKELPAGSFHYALLYSK